MLDDYQPTRFAPMMSLPLGAGGGFRLRPGLYALTVESFCLQPGAFRPGRGDGYEVAPLKGTGADAVQTILRNTSAHPEIPQGDVQLLLWGVIARTPIGDMDAPLQTSGGDAGTCGDNPPGRDDARDEKAAYEERAKRLRDAIANAKACKG